MEHVIEVNLIGEQVVRKLFSLALVVLGGLGACAMERSSAVEVTIPSRKTATDTATAGHHKPHAGMLRYPDVGASAITFVYANDIWTVAREGGTATPLASPPGAESFPRFSADSSTIAFVGNYEGNRDIYTIGADGGVATRVTHHPSRETLCGWTPSGELLFFTSGFAGLARQAQLMTVSASGGLPKKLPVPYGANGSISPDGQWLAYTPHTRDHRTWKRYRGGMATDIWLFNLNTHASKKITDWEGTDSQPMWHGDAVYYLSDDGPTHRLNIWRYDTKRNKRKQVTNFDQYDVKWPAIGPGPTGSGEIVFQYGPDLVLLDLANETSSVVDVSIPGDKPKIRSHDVDSSKFITNGDISSTGKRAVFEARGDIWTVPAKHGSPKNLTHTNNAAERDPSWSPDGQWIAYFSDATGEYELYIQQSDGLGETKQLTKNGDAYRYSPTWSPDSKLISFFDKAGDYFVHTIESGETKKFDTEPWASPSRMSWSYDSNWITYTKGGDNVTTSIWLYNIESGEKHQVTSGMFNDSSPTFDRQGDYLFFASNRAFTSPAYEDVGTSFIYAGTDLLFAVPLRDEVGSPWAPKNDEESWGDESEKDDASDDDDDDDAKSHDKKADKKNDSSKDDDSESYEHESQKHESGERESGHHDDKVKAKDHAEKDASDDDGKESKAKKKEKDEDEKLVIELEGFERRALKIPVDKGNFSQLAVNNDDKLVYVRQGSRGSGRKPSIKIFDLTDDEKEEKTILDGVGQFSMTADGKKLLVRKGHKMAIVEAKPKQKMDKPLSTKGMTARVEPHEEWQQMFREAWRIQRDFFYDPNMHGVDWNAVYKQYEPMVEGCASREDLAYVIGEMISEINVGHAYVRGGGDFEKSPRVATGMLGADFELRDGAYQISKIYEGAPWDYDARGPLSQPDVDVKEGDYLLAVNGVALDTSQDPWAAFGGLVGRSITITVSEKPTKDDDAREIIIEPMKSERTLRYRAWIEHNRKYVEDQSDGQIGYVYVPDTGVNGQNNLFRQFYGQRDKAALIIDERWNGGGQIPTRFIELLNRPIANYWARRDGHDWSWPPDAHQGPKCMLINGLAGSGGDYFPFYFRKVGLGKLIGMRTWGGLVGYSGNPSLIDSGGITSPTFAFYETDGTWGIEGHGVDPDIEVVDDPALMVDGGDPQLDAAIEHLLSEIKRHPYVKPKRPAYPNRSGMGIAEDDK